jgi:hypothetical protein
MAGDGIFGWLGGFDNRGKIFIGGDKKRRSDHHLPKT